ncbi:DUF3071 domain-containing protein [Bifidobacterium saguini]|nr:septation protein SepH [Bifidobacterium saguini]QTB90675.1 DUF3071 domain-containing protein [Bifidobacterium saguini]
MPENRLEKAHFERVSDTGDLVFSVGDRYVAISLDDTLERAILEAKQVKSETQKSTQPHEQVTLPISQIQSLIRAGADPSRVAQRYGLSETLVRRFSAAVETEKQYAIEQFLTVPAPKDSRVRTINDLVERTLASASIGMESVTWKSTRRGLEPWRIVAIFTSAGREIHAEWTWNMHDNSVVCLNNAARKLLGERSSADDSKSAAKVLPTPDLPGDSVRSARIERAVSAWAAPKPSIPAAVPQAAVTDSGAFVAPNTVNSGSADSSASGSMPPVKIPGAATPTLPSPSEALNTGSATSDASTVKVPSDSTAAGNGNGTADSTNATGNGNDAQQESAGNDANTSASHAARPAKRRSGRSAVPSWDEILFGD